MPRPAQGERRRGSAALGVVPGEVGTKRLILETAQRLFEEKGYDATSLREIAEAVGMTKAAVYYHFAAKEQLLLALTRPMLDALADLVARLRDDPDAASADALAAYLDVFLEHFDVVRLLSQDPATQNHPDIGVRIRTLVEAVQHQVAGAGASETRSVRTACAMGVVHAVATLAPEAAAANREVVLAAASAALDAP